MCMCRAQTSLTHCLPPAFVPQGTDSMRVLRMDLRDHRRRRLTLLVHGREQALFEAVLAEATRRFDRCGLLWLQHVAVERLGY